MFFTLQLSITHYLKKSIIKRMHINVIIIIFWNITYLIFRETSDSFFTPSVHNPVIFCLPVCLCLCASGFFLHWAKSSLFILELLFCLKRAQMKLLQWNCCVLVNSVFPLHSNHRLHPNKPNLKGTSTFSRTHSHSIKQDNDGLKS